MEEYHIGAYKVPVLAKPDVCIVGGGTAGLSAAIGAARSGMSVLLIEKYGFCGGATVAGLSGTIGGLFSSGDRPEQIVFGYADEFYQELIKRDGITPPIPFGRTVLLPHDSLIWKEVADKMLADAGVEVLYHTQFLRAFEDEAGNVETLLVNCQDGQFANNNETNHNHNRVPSGREGQDMAINKTKNGGCRRVRRETIGNLLKENDQRKRFLGSSKIQKDLYWRRSHSHK
jgi:hypothetical protein